MKIFSMTLASLATLVAIQTVGFQTAVAQDSTTGLVAVLDVAKVFKEHTVFNARMEKLKSEVDDFDLSIKQEAEALRSEMEALKDNVEPSSDAFKAGQGELARKDADLKIKTNQKRQEILDQEAELYLATYQEIQGHVEQLCVEYGITLVLRYDSTPIDKSDRASVIKGVNRPIIFQRNLDLTNHVIPKVKSTQASVGGTNQK